MSQRIHSDLIEAAFKRTGPLDGPGFRLAPDAIDISKKREKLAIVLSGGGMSCTYIVGAMIALLEKFNLAHPDILIAGSGSAGTASFFTAEQYYQVVNIWANLLSTPEFIGLKYRPINIDYLIDTVFKKQAPLDTGRILTSPIDYLIPATNANTGDVEYFGNKKSADHIFHDGDDIFEVMRATKAMPVVFRKRIRREGEEYIDTYASSHIELNILRAIEEGAKKVLGARGLLQ